VAAWMYNYSLGIQRDPEHPGFKQFVLEPTPDPDKKMTWAKGYYDSMYGRIESEWRWESEGWTYNAIVPANTKATLRINTSTVKNITSGGVKLKKAKGVKVLESEGAEVVLELVSGRYNFIISE
ncbi:MAG: alpha-L-rhamnosidase, partial [Pricia sp.]|nr:alpha-L-rhamnosidase [Pricia sp.]